MHVTAHNRAAWDREVEAGNPHTIPAGPDEIAAARRGEWQLHLIDKPVPHGWLPELHARDALCLGGGGGQQGPLLAAAGAHVTVLDNSPRQLAQDQAVAAREGLALTTVLGDMADLSVFGDASFDLIVNPASTIFVPDVRPVWRACFRVLRPGGLLLAALLNPVEYIFDRYLMDTYDPNSTPSEQARMLQVRFSLPYSDLTALSEAEREQLYGPGGPVEFGHTLEDQIGGQLDAGFVITGYDEHHRSDSPLGHYIATLMATRAQKPPLG